VYLLGFCRGRDIGLCNNSDNPVLVIHYRNSADLVLLHQPEAVFKTVLRFASDRICAHRVAHFCGSWLFTITISDNGATQVSICYDTLEPLRLMIVNNGH
jgi:hypothetical protein